jgi:hypothetical protein
MAKEVADTHEAAEWEKRLHKRLTAILTKERGLMIQFATYWNELVVYQGWKLRTDRNGAPFPDYRSYALADRPYGLGMAEDEYALHLRFWGGPFRDPMVDDYPPEE